MCPMNIEFSYIDGGKHPVLGQVLHLSISPANGDQRYLNFLCNPLRMVIHTIEDCNIAIETVNQVLSGNVTETLIDGNDTEIVIGPDTVHVTILDAENSEGVFPTGELKSVLIGFGHFLKMPESIHSKHEITF